MQKKTAELPFIHIILELAMMIVIGIVAILFYGYPLKFNRMVIFFLSYGTAAIVLFNVLKFTNIKAFLITLLVIMIVITPLVFKNPTFYSIIHHAGWTIGLGIIIYLMEKVFPKRPETLAKIWALLLWIIAFTLFLYGIFIINGLILKYRHGKDTFELVERFFRALKFGPVIGGGIGLGNILALTIWKR